MKRGRSISLLENVAILYIFFVLALISLVYFAGIGDINTTIVFVISGFVISFFSKNMTVILLFTLVISHIYKYGVDNMRIYREGLTAEEEAAAKQAQKEALLKQQELENQSYKKLENTPLISGTTLDVNDIKNKIKTQEDILTDIIPKVNNLKMISDLSGDAIKT